MAGSPSASSVDRRPSTSMTAAHTALRTPSTSTANSTVSPTCTSAGSSARRHLQHGVVAQAPDGVDRGSHMPMVDEGKRVRSARLGVCG